MAGTRARQAGDRLTDRQQAVLDTLLLTGSVPATAERIGVRPASVYQMLGREPLKSAYRSAREEASRAAIALLQAGMSDAAGYLNSVVTNEEVKPAIRLSAAIKVLEFGIQGVSLDIMRREIDELKAAIGERS